MATETKKLKAKKKKQRFVKSEPDSVVYTR